MTRHFTSTWMPSGKEFGAVAFVQAIEGFWESAGDRYEILLMEEILHHMGCKKPCK